MNVSTLGIDLAKAVFQLHGVDEHGQVALSKRLSRQKLLPFSAIALLDRNGGLLRALLIHGARATVQHAAQKSDARSEWINCLCHRRRKNVTAVVVANKNARILWALLARGKTLPPGSLSARVHLRSIRSRESQTDGVTHRHPPMIA